MSAAKKWQAATFIASFLALGLGAVACVEYGNADHLRAGMAPAQMQPNDGVTAAADPYAPGNTGANRTEEGFAEIHESSHPTVTASIDRFSRRPQLTLGN
ncbi:MAG: hypothetical protein ACLQT5_13275 [Steroidobacteraceae bacterium]|jgi:hypothetical protein